MPTPYLVAQGDVRLLGPMEELLVRSQHQLPRRVATPPVIRIEPLDLFQGALEVLERLLRVVVQTARNPEVAR